MINPVFDDEDEEYFIKFDIDFMRIFVTFVYACKKQFRMEFILIF